MEPVTNEAECEMAAQHVGAGRELGRGGAVSLGKWAWIPQHCSIYHGDWSPHFNTRPPIL